MTVNPKTSNMPMSDMNGISNLKSAQNMTQMQIPQIPMPNIPTREVPAPQNQMQTPFTPLTPAPTPTPMQLQTPVPMRVPPSSTIQSPTPAGDTTPINFPETVTNPLYMPAFLTTQIGKTMRVEFLIGNQINDRVGILLSVGASYIILQSIDTVSMVVCDLYSIKFVTIVGNIANLPLAP